MREQLLGYLLGELSAEQRRRVEQALAARPSLRKEMERLRACLVEGQCDEDVADPPIDLAARTAKLVSRVASGDWAPSANWESSAAEEPGRWRMTDITVTAGVCLAVAMLMLPALRASRDAARRIACENQMGQLGLALVCYSGRHDGQLPLVGINEPAGIFTVKLAASGSADRQQLSQWVVCPASELAGQVYAGRAAVRIPLQAEIEHAVGADRSRLEQHMGGTYAYRIGYWRGNQYVGIQLPDRMREPLLADAPAYRDGQPTAVNHVCGANVLYADLSVRHHTDCLANDGIDNLFVNSAGHRAAGSSPRDVVLATSDDRPTGPNAWKLPTAGPVKSIWSGFPATD